MEEAPDLGLRAAKPVEVLLSDFRGRPPPREEGFAHGEDLGRRGRRQWRTGGALIAGDGLGVRRESGGGGAMGEAPAKNRAGIRWERRKAVGEEEARALNETRHRLLSLSPREEDG